MPTIDMVLKQGVIGLMAVQPTPMTGMEIRPAVIEKHHPDIIHTINTETRQVVLEKHLMVTIFMINMATKRVL